MLNFSMLFPYTVLVLLHFTFPYGMVYLYLMSKQFSTYSMLSFQIINSVPLSFSNILFLNMCIVCMYVCLCVSVYMSTIVLREHKSVSETRELE